MLPASQGSPRPVSLTDSKEGCRSLHYQEDLSVIVQQLVLAVLNSIAMAINPRILEPLGKDFRRLLS